MDFHLSSDLYQNAKIILCWYQHPVNRLWMDHKPWYHQEKPANFSLRLIDLAFYVRRVTNSRDVIDRALVIYDNNQYIQPKRSYSKVYDDNYYGRFLIWFKLKNDITWRMFSWIFRNWIDCTNGVFFASYFTSVFP